MALGIVLDAESNDLVLEYDGNTVNLLPQDGHGNNGGKAGPRWNCAEMNDLQFSTLGSIECGKWSMPPSATIGSRLKQSGDEEKRVKQERSSMFLESVPSKGPSHPLSRGGGGMKKKSAMIPTIIKNHSAKSPLGSSPLVKRSPFSSSLAGEERKVSVGNQFHNTPAAGANQSLSPELVETKLIHILACKPADVDDCVMKTNSSHDKVLAILGKIGYPQASNPKLFQLKADSYKSLNPWQYESYTPQERAKAIKNATIAFDSLKLPKYCKERKALVPPPGIIMDQTDSSGSSITSLSPNITANIPNDNSVLNPNGHVRTKRKMSDSVGNASIKIRKKDKSEDLTNTSLSIDGDVTARKRTNSGFQDSTPSLSPKKSLSIEQFPQKHLPSPLVANNPTGKSVSQLLEPIQSPINQIIGTDASFSPSKQKDKITVKKFLDSSEWKQLAVTELSKYVSYLYAFKNHLAKKLTFALKLGNEISALLDPTLGSFLTSNALIIKSENQKLALIKSKILKAGFQATPASFLSVCAEIKELFLKVRSELDYIQKWIQEKGGTLLIDSLDV